MATSPAPTAPVGYIGYGLIFDYPVRGANFNVKAHQQVYNGDPVSNEVDQPMYHVGPLEVEGDVSWPLVFGDPVISKIITMTTERIATGGAGTKKTLRQGNITTFFPPASGTDAYSRTATGCIVNRLSFKGNAGERVEGTINVIGLNITEDNGNKVPVPFDMGRVMTWDDVTVSASFDKNKSRFAGCSVKEFSFEINNNVTRANTYCWPETKSGLAIAATTVVLGKRQVSGSLTFIGSSATQAQARENILTQTPTDGISIIMGPIKAQFHRVVYELQQIDLTSGVIYGRTSFTAHGGGPGEPSVEFSMSTVEQQANQDEMRLLEQEMAARWTVYSPGHSGLYGSPGYSGLA